MAPRITPEKTDAPAQAPPAAGAEPEKSPILDPNDPTGAGTPKVILATGGGAPGDKKVATLGRWWKCRVLELLDPDAVNPVPVAVAWPGMFYKETIRTNTICVLPDAAIAQLQTFTRQTTTQRIQPGSPLYRNEEAALIANPSAEVVWRGQEMYLVKSRQRFSIERLEQLAGPPDSTRRSVQ